MFVERFILVQVQAVLFVQGVSAALEPHLRFFQHHQCKIGPNSDVVWSVIPDKCFQTKKSITCEGPNGTEPVWKEYEEVGCKGAVKFQRSEAQMCRKIFSNTANSDDMPLVHADHDAIKRMSGYTVTCESSPSLVQQETALVIDYQNDPTCGVDPPTGFGGQTPPPGLSGTMNFGCRDTGEITESGYRSELHSCSGGNWTRITYIFSRLGITIGPTVAAK